MSIAPQDRNALHNYLRQHGAMLRTNKELLRLAKVTGYSAGTLYHVALGRKTSLALATAVAKAVRGKAVTVDQLLHH